MPRQDLSDAKNSGSSETPIQQRLQREPPHGPTRNRAALHRRVDTSFMQYASYVFAIVPFQPGRRLKQVQRRIFWFSMKDDGHSSSGDSCRPLHAISPAWRGLHADALVVLATGAI